MRHVAAFDIIGAGRFDSLATREVDDIGSSDLAWIMQVARLQVSTQYVLLANVQLAFLRHEHLNNDHEVATGVNCASFLT